VRGKQQAYPPPEFEHCALVNTLFAAELQPKNNLGIFAIFDFLTLTFDLSIGNRGGALWNIFLFA